MTSFPVPDRLIIINDDEATEIFTQKRSVEPNLESVQITGLPLGLFCGANLEMHVTLALDTL
jgi:hypothetical protein